MACVRALHVKQSACLFLFPSGYNGTASGWSDWDPLQGCVPQGRKLDNIRIETCSDVPRARIISFGAFLSEGMYTKEQGRLSFSWPCFLSPSASDVYLLPSPLNFVCIVGTEWYTSPEWFLDGCYRAELSTLRQLIVMIFGVLHRCLLYNNDTEIVDENPDLSASLSFCRSKTHTHSRTKHMQEHTHGMVKCDSLLSVQNARIF